MMKACYSPGDYLSQGYISREPASQGPLLSGLVPGTCIINVLLGSERKMKSWNRAEDIAKFPFFFGNAKYLLGRLCTARRREKKKVSLGDRPVSTSSIRINIHARIAFLYIPDLFRHSPFGNADLYASILIFYLFLFPLYPNGLLFFLNPATSI